MGLGQRSSLALPPMIPLPQLNAIVEASVSSQSFFILVGYSKLMFNENFNVRFKVEEEAKNNMNKKGRRRWTGTATPRFGTAAAGDNHQEFFLGCYDAMLAFD